MKPKVFIQKDFLLISFVILSVLSFQSCKEKPTPPILSTNEASDISTNTAVSGGVVSDDGGASVISKGICWNTSDDPTIENDKTTESVQSKSFTSNLSGLLPKTKYYVRAYATNEAGTAYGNSISFTTLGEKPGFNNLTVSNIQLNSSTLNASVNSNSLSTTIHFEWGTTLNYGNTFAYSQNPIAGNDPLTLSADLSGLTPGTTYHFRIKAENSLGVSFSDDMTFKTLGDAPTVTILSASNTHVRSSSLNGSVNPNYLSSTVIFEWGTTMNYGNTVTAVQSPVTGNLPISVSAEISGLSPGTTYYVRIKAENLLGISYSDKVTFSTPEMEWIKSSDFPGTARCSPLSFVYNDKGYYGLGRNTITGENLHDFWSFDPATSAWTRLSDCPFTFISGLSSRCLVGSTMYVFKEWALYSYDINLDTWKFLCNSGISLSDVSGFSINGKPFFFKANSELYEYIPGDKTFLKKESIISNYLNWGLNETFVLNNEAFLLHKNNTKVEIYHYISQSDTWEKKLEKEFSNPAFQKASFLVTIDNCAYIGESTTFLLSTFDENATVTPKMPSSNVWKYDPLKNEFKQGPSLPGVFRAQTGNFSFQNTAYIIGGVTVDPDTHKFVYLKDVWINR